MPGIGGLYVKSDRELSTIIEGGTGVNSISLVQPGYSPEKFEAGTLNYIGIVVLGKCTQYIRDIGLNRIREHEYRLLDYISKELADLPEVQLVGNRNILEKYQYYLSILKTYPPMRLQPFLTVSIIS